MSPQVLSFIKEHIIEGTFTLALDRDFVRTMPQSPATPATPRDHQLVEYLTLDFADTAYQCKSTPVGQARKNALRAFCHVASTVCGEMGIMY